MKNQQVAMIFGQLANLLELKGEGPYRIRAYRKAADTISQLQEAIEQVADRNELEALAGIGRDLARKIREILATGTMAVYEDLKKETPAVLVEFISLPGLKPYTARYLYERLGIQSLEDLERMVRTHMLRTIPDIDKNAEEKILRGIRELKERGPAGSIANLNRLC